MTFNYGYDDDYLGYGPECSTTAHCGLMTATLNGDPYQTLQRMTVGCLPILLKQYYYDSATGYYSTNIFEGEAYIGAGEPIIADCDDTEAGIFPGAAELESTTLCLTDMTTTATQMNLTATTAMSHLLRCFQ